MRDGSDSCFKEEEASEMLLSFQCQNINKQWVKHGLCDTESSVCLFPYYAASPGDKSWRFELKQEQYQ